MEIIRYHFNSIESTNTWAKLNAHEFQQDKITLVTADEQTAGRGRFKRRWESPPKQNIYATFCFFVDKYSNEIGNIPQVLALSASAALRRLHVDPMLKWPNDLLLSGKKIGGILAETTTLDKLCVIIGIGLNINMPFETLMLIDRPATSLLVETKTSFNPEEILSDLTLIFKNDLNLFFAKGFAPFLEPYKKSLSADPSKLIHFHDNQKIWKGTFHAINQDGSLALKLNTGQIKTFITGEILWPPVETMELPG